MSQLSADLRHTVRTMKSMPGFFLTAVFMLALGIGSCTAVFTVVNAVMLRPLPYPEPERLVQLWEVSERGSTMNVPEANFIDWRNTARSFDGMAAFGSRVVPIIGGAEPVRARMAVVSAGFFDVLGIKPVMGGGLLPEHHRADASPVAVVSFGFWKRALGGRDLGSQRVSISDQSYLIVGVMPDGPSFPVGAEIWTPSEPGNTFNPSRSAHNWSVIARLRPGAGVASATKELGSIARDIHGKYADVTAVDARAVLLQDQLTRNVRVALPVLLAAVGVLLAVACANVANLLLAHITARRRELAVRTAMGAGAGAIARLFLAQSLTLTAVGSLLGTVLAELAVPALLRLSDGTLPRIGEVRTDGWVLAFALLVSLAVGLVLGLVPAFRAGRMNLHETLKEGGRSQTRGTADRRVRNSLVVLQVAMTIVLMVGAGLLGRSFVQLLQTPLGFQTSGRVAVEMLSSPPDGSDQRRLTAASIERLIQSAAALPGVTVVGGINSLPLTGSVANGRFLIEGRKDSGDYWPNYRVATRGYFEAMGIVLVRGRFFNATDGADTPEVAVISQSVAERVWPDIDPIGRRINYGNMDGDSKFMTIVGIVSDVRNSPEAAVEGDIYVHYLQRGYLGNFTMVVRSAGGTETLIPALTAQVRQLRPEASARIRTLDTVFASSLTNRRFNFALFAVFGGAALLLALTGVYGVTSYSVAQRTQEIGIRLALGANTSSVVRLFLGEGCKLVLIGIVLGSVAAIISGRVLESLLVNVRTTDATTYLLVAVPMFLAAVLACHLPARRAARVDPLVTIQSR